MSMSLSRIRLGMRNGHHLSTNAYKVYCLSRQARIWLEAIKVKHKDNEKWVRQANEYLERDLWTLQDFKDELPTMYRDYHKQAFTEAKKMYQERKPVKAKKVKEPAF